MEPTDNTPILDPVDMNLIQKIVGTFFYYGITVDNTILVALSTISNVVTACEFEKIFHKRDLLYNNGKTITEIIFLGKTSGILHKF